ncbi:hypothetical protein JCM2811A_33180 [Methylorubrum rhodinum]
MRISHSHCTAPVVPAARAKPVMLAIEPPKPAPVATLAATRAAEPAHLGAVHPNTRFGSDDATREQLGPGVHRTNDVPAATAQQTGTAKSRAVACR